jgi:hypothetical protein
MIVVVVDEGGDGSFAFHFEEVAIGQDAGLWGLVLTSSCSVVHFELEAEVQFDIISKP